jgi:hemolysin activation/secretion protein
MPELRNRQHAARTPGGRTTGGGASYLDPVRGVTAARAVPSRLSCLSLALLCAAVAPAWAQPGVDERGAARGAPPLELPEPRPAAPEIQLPPLPRPERPSLADAPRVFVREIRLEGATVALTVRDPETGEERPVDLDAITARYENREITTEQLLELRDELTLAYIRSGYVNSGAVIPDQEVVDGVITIRIIEGELGAINLAGLHWLDAAFLEARMRLGAGPPLDVDRLQDRLQLLLLDPSIERLNAQLGPGSRPGEASLDVDVTEAQNFRITGRLANDRSPDIGGTRGALGFAWNSVFGYSDPLFIDVGYTFDLSGGPQNSEGLKDGSFYYSIPLTPQDLRLYATAEVNSSAIVEQELRDLEIESLSRSGEAGLSLPLYETLDDTVTMRLGMTIEESRTTLLNEPFSSAPGIVDGTSNLTVLRFGQDWQHRGRELALAARSTFSLGLPIFGATENPKYLEDDQGRRLLDLGQIPDASFGAWLGQLEAAYRPFQQSPIRQIELSQLRLRGGLQLAADPLFPIEQYSVGGLDTVRGYRENTIVRDNGWSASIEARVPTFQLQVPGIEPAPDQGWLELVPFFDIGRGWNTNRPDPDDVPKSISSAGMGLRWSPAPDWVLEVSWAYTFDDVMQAEDEDILIDNGINFLIRTRFY